MTAFISLVFAYLLGSVPFGYLAGRLLGQGDIRDHGSGNIGATNVMRLLGPGAAALVLVLDIGKGLLAVGAARLITGQEHIWLLSALAVLIGHCWPIFLKFRGGKGTATGLGTLFLLVGPPVWGAILILAVIVIVLTRYVSLVSILAAVAFPILLWIFNYPPTYIYLGLAISLLIILRHKANIDRLLRGRESKLGEKVGISGEKKGGS